jgi:TonB family protein
MFAPMEAESLLVRLGRELGDGSREFLADPIGYVRNAFTQDDYEKKRRKIVFLGSLLCLVVAFLSVFIVLLIQFLKTPEITGLLPKNQIAYVEPTFLEPLPAPEMKERAGGGGGGGRNELNPPSFGKLPQASLRPPLIDPSPHPPKIEHPSLPVLPTVQAQPELIPQTNQNLPFGDPTSVSMIPSAGPGSGGGIGTGSGGGVGPGRGVGVGPGEGWNTGGGSPRIGGGDRPARTGPQILNNPRPDWTEEARRNRIQGEVWLDVIFGADGQVRGVRIVRGLGYGLDEKAIEAAKLIKFVPARDLNGNPVDYRQRIKVTFTLL